MALAHTVDKDQALERLGPDAPVRIVQGRTYDVLTAADAAAAAIGTITLEAALIGCPFVGFYRMSASMHWIARRLYRGEHVVLPNIIAKRRIVPELIQEDATPERIAEAIDSLFVEERRKEIVEGFQEVRRLLGGPGAIQRTADEVLRVAKLAADEAKGVAHVTADRRRDGR